MSSDPTSRALRYAEGLLGRKLLWRTSRRMYLAARRDGMGDPATNGEYALHRRVARYAASQNRTFTIIDVGCFTGYWSYHLLGSCRDSGVKDVKLLAMEPSPESRAKFTSRMEGAYPDYSVRVREQAVSDYSGEAMFDIDTSRAGSHSLIAAENPGTPSGTYRVNVITLADLFADEKFAAVDFVKTDAEGFDFSIIKGALPLLKEGRIGLMQFEYNSRWLTTRTMLRDVFDLLPGIPYRLCKVAPEGLEAYQRWSSELERFFEANYVLLRKDLVGQFGIRECDFDAQNTFGPV